MPYPGYVRSEMTDFRHALQDTRRVPAGLEAYFPPCVRPDCPRARTPHRDVLPHQLEFIAASEKYLCMLGGYGAGKTLQAAIKGILLSKQIAGNRGLVGRLSYSKLHDSTLPIYLEVMQRVGIEYEQREVRDGFPHRVILPNGSEIVFRETKDLGRFLGPEYGWFHLDEASELPKKNFTDLQGRLRLPHARFYLTGFITSNPPHHTDWIPEIFGTTPGITDRGGSQYRLWQVPSTVNPFLPESYVSDLKATHTESEFRRIVGGEYGFTFEGKAVYMPPFDFGRHVAELKPLLGVTVVRAWDFGYHRPAVTWHQFPLCASRRVHWQRIHEYIGADLESEQLADLVLEQSRTVFPDHPRELFLDCGDRAGAQRSEKGPGPIARLAKDPWRLRFKHRNIPNIDPGIALIRDALRGDCLCGRPIMQINRTCRHGIEGFAGGYHYPPPRHGVSSAVTDKPKKDGFYDNLADADRYVAENFYRGLLRDPEIIDRLLADQGPRFAAAAPSWGWMGS